LVDPGLLLLAGVAVLLAQVPFYRPGTVVRGRIVEGTLPEKRTGFTFCRLVYDRSRTEAGGSGWGTDFPMADQNLMIRLSELTLTPVTKFEEGDPAHALVRASDPAIYGCPFLFASDAGTVGFDEAEVEGLRNYLLKGGFLWVDDFWGNRAWSHWVSQITRVLPEFDVVELPMSHPIFSTFYSVDRIPQIASIRHWSNSGGSTSERGAESAIPHVAAVLDNEGRLLVLMSHNTDIADGWEREGEDINFFHLFSPPAYAVGVNVAIWSMTH
jgi:hypothetical protein